MKIILFGIFIFIFYTILVELSVEDTGNVQNTSNAPNNANTQSKNWASKTLKKVDYKLKPEKNILRKTSSTKQTKEYNIDQSLIDEALQFDQNTNLDIRAKESLEQSFLKSMADKQLNEQNSKEYKKQFIRAYLKKAKEAGYIIRLNSHLQVISVENIKTYDPILIEEE